MSVLTVGVGQQFSTLKAAVAASHDGDTIYVAAGVYVNDFAIINTKVNIIGVGGMAHFVHDGSIPIPNGKAIFVVNADASFDHIEFSGAKVPDQNGAGIKLQSGDLTVTNCYFHNNQTGILTSAIAGAVVTIDHSEFGPSGASSANPHNIYIGRIDTVSITNSYFHDANVGHEIKSRAANTIVMDSRIFDLNGTASYSIDLPNGGAAIIKNNIIQQGPKSENNAIISYAALEVSYPDSSLLVTGNTIINQKSSVRGIVNHSDLTVQIIGNKFYGITTSEIGLGPNSQSGNSFLASLPALDTSHPWNPSPWEGLISGGDANDVLLGSAGPDLLVGGGGSDTFSIKAQGNSDTIADFAAGIGIGDVVKLDGYALADFASVKQGMTAAGSDTVLSLGNGGTLTFLDVSPNMFAPDDFIFVNSGGTGVQPFILPVSGASTTSITGTQADDLLMGTIGNDRIDGRSGIDTMKGGNGHDTFVVNKPLDVVIENAGQGIDTVRAISSYTLPANVENLQITNNEGHVGVGNSLNNLITASNKGKDTIDAGAGNDIIVAGIGASVFTGGIGNDMIVFSATGALSRITDFHVGEDLLDLRPLMSAAGYGGSDPVADGVIALSGDGSGGVIVSVDPTNSGTMIKLVDLVGVAPSSLGIGTELLWQ